MHNHEGTFNETWQSTSFEGKRTIGHLHVLNPKQFHNHPKSTNYDYEAIQACKRGFQRTPSIQPRRRIS